MLGEVMLVANQVLAARQEEEEEQDEGNGLGYLPTQLCIRKAENPVPRYSIHHQASPTFPSESITLPEYLHTFLLLDTQYTIRIHKAPAPTHFANMLMSSLASIQAAGIYTPETVPIEKTYGLPAEAKQDTAAASGATSSESSPPSDASRSVTRSP